jgi:hypothetical protein
MVMEQAVQSLNEMVSAGLISEYAIGGAMAAYFYAEAVLTEDLNAFVLLPATASKLVVLTPIYDRLKRQGAVEVREHLLFRGVLLQLIPAYDGLTEEAVKEAATKMVGKAAARVMRVEHLLTISLQTGRPKDHARIALLLEEAEVDPKLLAEILSRHRLSERWARLKEMNP